MTQTVDSTMGVSNTLQTSGSNMTVVPGTKLHMVILPINKLRPHAHFPFTAEVIRVPHEILSRVTATLYQ